MKNLLLIVMVTFAFGSVSLAQDNTKKIMEKLGMELDTAETNLRVLSGKAANGEPFSGALKSLNSCDSKLMAALRLLAFEQRHPGYLQGLHGNAEKWEQYKEVRKLFDELQSKNDAFALNRQRSESKENKSSR